ncbi:hypothetical protein [Salinispora pacifica]|uniref:hypothetical protein n=1 Tax=Salinispora pacifica TaxID=351187 RepID=UPI000374E4D7|nr:hypothetical protein [Salinispora pacifica]
MTRRTCATPLARRVTVGSATVLAAGVLLTGCGLVSSEPPPPPTPKDALLAAVPGEKTPAFRFSGVDAVGRRITGAVDPTGKGMELNIAPADAESENEAEAESESESESENKADFSLAMSFRVVDQRSWLRVHFEDAAELNELLELPRQWMELDQSKLSNPQVYDSADIGNAGVIIRAADAVQQQADGAYTGTVDLTAGPEIAEAVAEVDVAALGEQATSIPFTAVVGSDGHLDTLTMEIPAVDEQPAAEFLVRYYDYGIAPAIASPTGDATPAPDVAYEILGE